MSILNNYEFRDYVTLYDVYDAATDSACDWFWENVDNFSKEELKKYFDDYANGGMDIELTDEHLDLLVDKFIKRQEMEFGEDDRYYFFEEIDNIILKKDI